MANLIELDGLSRGELIALVGSWGFHRLHAVRLWRYVYREGLNSFAAMPELPARLRARLQEETRFTSLTTATEQHSNDGLTQKFLLGLHDGQRVETVLMRFKGRVTACLSSQAGCALGCVFCATGQQGFGRNLSTGEIVAQAMHVARRSAGQLRNVVMMGMGEPLQNYDAVLKALDILSSSSGLAIGTKRITLSTIGIVPGILRLAEEERPYSLAVSLHAATQAERVALMPATRAWPLDELIEACRHYATQLDRKIFFEWTLIGGVNDSVAQATALAQLLQGIHAHVNLIPLNATARYDQQATDFETIDRFQASLQAYGLPSTVRQRRGLDIAAGCGQLAVGSSFESSSQR